MRGEWRRAGGRDEGRGVAGGQAAGSGYTKAPVSALLPPGTEINNMYIYLYIYTSGLGMGGWGPYTSLRTWAWQRSAPVGAGALETHKDSDHD